MTPKERYHSLCESEPSIPLFSQDWWLDSLKGEDSWDVSLVEKKGLIVAAMPFAIRRRLGRVLLGHPPLTQTLGPWIRDTGAKQTTRLARQKELMQQLIEALPKFDYYHQNWHYTQTNWLPFYWAGFNQTTRYTYVIEPIHDLDAVWQGFASSYRNKVRKAQKMLSLRTDITIEEFYRMNMLTFQRQEISEPYSLELIKSHDLALSKRNKRRIFSAHGESGDIHSALYLVWDDTTAYVHMVGEDPALRSSGAGILLIWEAIRYASEQLKVGRFDFEGSMIESVERVRRACGAVQVPYFSVSKTPSKLLRVTQCLRGLLR